MNLSKHIKVSHKEWENWKQYLADSGYELRETKKENSVSVAVLLSGEVSADLAMARQRVDGRWSNWITIRIPKAKES